jgi:branched-chain amino acid transport system ATP-binding protein
MSRATPLLSVRGLGKRFGGLQAVADVDLDVVAGEILGVIGPNGAGKSTTFNMIAGALQPTAGEVVLDGHSLRGVPTHEFAPRGIVRTFQHNKPFESMSVVQNIMVGMHGRIRSPLLAVLAGLPSAREAEHAAWKKADELADFVGLSEFKQAEVATLSFGQGRLLEIARSLAAEPRLLLLDEPAAGLTGSEVRRLEDIIRGIAKRGIAVLLIEHDMRFLMPLVDRIAVLNFGRKIAEGTPAEVQKHPAVVEAYLGDVEGLSHA